MTKLPTLALTLVALASFSSAGTGATAGTTDG